MINITFGICTEYEDPLRLQAMVCSIDDLQIPHYEIMLIGGTEPKHVTSQGTLWQVGSTQWLPSKKNVLSRLAHFENMVVCHDYFVFHPGWYYAYNNFSSSHSWDVCSNPQFLINGQRHFTDWVNWDDPQFPRYHSFDYDDWTHTKHQYISGGYMMIKRDFLQENPFDETMQPGSPEDVEWSLRIRDKAVIRCNRSAFVTHNKKHRDVK